MIEVLKFIFSSFWIWLGTFLVVGAIASGLASFRIVSIDKRTIQTKESDK